MVRAFEDEDTIHVEGRVDPAEDVEVINLELLLADLAHVERRLERSTCRDEERDALETVAVGLRAGIPARAVGLSGEGCLAIKSMGLLTLKPVMYAFNVDEADFTLGRQAALKAAEAALRSSTSAERQGTGVPSELAAELDPFGLVSAQLESDLAALGDEEQAEYLEDLGLEAGPCPLSHTVLPSMVLELLGLGLVYTGPGVPRESTGTVKAHLLRQGSLTAEDLAGRLHGDILRGFMCAEAAQHGQTAKSCQGLSSAPVPPQGAPGGSGPWGTSRGETGPLGAQPSLPRVLGLTASKAAEFPAFDHVGGACRGAATARELRPSQGSRLRADRGAGVCARVG